METSRNLCPCLCTECVNSSVTRFGRQYYGSSPGQRAILQLLCSQARIKLQEKLTQKRSSKPCGRAIDALCMCGLRADLCAVCLPLPFRLQFLGGLERDENRVWSWLLCWVGSALRDWGTGYTVGKSVLYRLFWFTASGGFAKLWSNGRFFKLANPVDARD